MTREAKLMTALHATTRIWWCGKNDDKLGALAHTPGMRLGLSSRLHPSRRSGHADQELVCPSRSEARQGGRACGVPEAGTAARAGRGHDTRLVCTAAGAEHVWHLRCLS